MSDIPAKPIIDIGIAVSNFEAAAACIAPMQKLGFHYRGENGIPRRHYFVKGQPSSYHVHMVEIESAEWLSLILFRDYLRTNLEVASEYARLKQKLASRFAGDRDAYQHAKAPFITNIVARAEQEIRKP